MNELYWITRLNDIRFVFISCIIIATVVIAVVIINYLADECEDLKERGMTPKRILKPSLVAFVIGALGIIFIPSTKQALMIYGIGGTIDYIKSSSKAQQLPDKVVDALDKYLDTINGNDKR